MHFPTRIYGTRTSGSANAAATSVTPSEAGQDCVTGGVHHHRPVTVSPQEPSRARIEEYLAIIAEQEQNQRDLADEITSVMISSRTRSRDRGAFISIRNSERPVTVSPPEPSRARVEEYLAIIAEQEQNQSDLADDISSVMVSSRNRSRDRGAFISISNSERPVTISPQEPSRARVDEYLAIIAEQEQNQSDLADEISSMIVSGRNRSRYRGAFISISNSGEQFRVDRRRASVSPLNQGNNDLRFPPPASDKAIRKLPHARVLPCHNQSNKNDATLCGICHDRLLDGFAVGRLPCGHMYHFSCIIPWLSRTCTCPECRYEMETYDEEYEIGRKQRMRHREVHKCSCRPFGFHECFYFQQNCSLSDGHQCEKVPEGDAAQDDVADESCASGSVAGVIALLDQEPMKKSTAAAIAA